jgi:hypothetical protein
VAAKSGKRRQTPSFSRARMLLSSPVACVL